MEHAPSPPPKLELILETQAPRQVPTGPTQPQLCNVSTGLKPMNIWGKDLTKEAADLKMTPKGAQRTPGSGKWRTTHH